MSEQQPPEGPAPRPQPGPAPYPGSQPGQQPGQQPGYGQPFPPQYYSQQGHPYGQPPPPPPWSGGPPTQGHDRRPGQVTAAAVITWIFAGLTLVLAVILTAFAASGNPELFDSLAEQVDASMDREELRSAMIVTGLVMAFWSACAIVLAFLVLRRQNWARITLAVSAGFTVLISLLGISSGGSVLTLAAGVAVLVLLFLRPANDWFRRQPAHPGGYPNPTWPGPSAYPGQTRPGQPYPGQTHPGPPPGPPHPGQPDPGESAGGSSGGSGWTSGGGDSGPPRPPAGGW